MKWSFWIEYCVRKNSFFIRMWGNTITQIFHTLGLKMCSYTYWGIDVCSWCGNNISRRFFYSISFIGFCFLGRNFCFLKFRQINKSCNRCQYFFRYWCSKIWICIASERVNRKNGKKYTNNANCANCARNVNVRKPISVIDQNICLFENSF